MVALMLCYHSVAPCTCKGDISASAICHLYMCVFSFNIKDRPKYASFCCFDGLSYGSSFYFAASRVQSTN